MKLTIKMPCFLLTGHFIKLFYRILLSNNSVFDVGFFKAEVFLAVYNFQYETDDEGEHAKYS